LSHAYNPSFQSLKDATLLFSSATPNLALVIPVMDRIDKILGNLVEEGSFVPAIVVAMGVARKTLNRYYSLVNSSPVYRIAMRQSFNTFILLWL